MNEKFVETVSRGLAAIQSVSSKLALGMVLAGAAGCWGFDMGDVGGPGFPGPGGSGSPSEQLAFRYEVFELDQGVVTEVTSGCERVPTSETSGATGFGFGIGRVPGGDGVAYSVEYSFMTNNVEVNVRNIDTGEDVLERVYDEEFVLSGEQDESIAELTPEVSLVVIGQGVDSCS